MYRWMRNIHLWVGLAVFCLLGVYLLSSVRFAHNNWFSRDAEVEESTVPVDPTRAETPRQLARQLIAERGVRGELGLVRPVKGEFFEFAIRRPGTRYEIRYRRGADVALVKRTRQGWSGMLTSLHVAHGLWHETTLFNVWGALVFVASIALFALGATGVYLWFKTYDERKIGLVILTAGLAYAFYTMYLVRSLG